MAFYFVSRSAHHRRLRLKKFFLDFKKFIFFAAVLLISSLTGIILKSLSFNTLVSNSKFTCMLKQMLSVSDVNQLRVGDQISDHADFLNGKVYRITNISRDLIYAIAGDKQFELKVIRGEELASMRWWVYVQQDLGQDVLPT